MVTVRIGDIEQPSIYHLQCVQVSRQAFHITEVVDRKPQVILSTLFTL